MARPIKIIIDNQKVRQRLARIQGRFANFKPVLEGPALRYVEAGLKANFDTHGAWSGRPWAPLALSTILKKIKAGVIQKGTLRFTDQLYHAVATPFPFSPLKRIRINKTSLTIQILDRKAKYHQLGTLHMPMRQVVPDPMPKTFIDGLRKIITGYLVQVTLTTAGS